MTSAPSAERWAPARNLLCVRLDGLGDVLMTTPALRALKESTRGRRLTLLTSPSGAPAGRLVPEVDEVIVYEAPWVKSTALRADRRADEEMIRRLAEGRFEGAVIFTVYSQNPLPAALLCYLSGIPLRAAHCRENPYALLTDWMPDPEPLDKVRHEVRRQLDLVAALGGRTTDERLSIAVGGAALSRVRELLSLVGVDTARPWAVLHPGSTAPSRRYRPDGYAEAAGRLARDFGWQMVITGSAEEVPLIESIRAAMGAPSATLGGMLDLGELAALLSLAPVLIANNTGPVHVAAAVGTPVVDLYALTNPQHTPWGVPSRVLNHDVPCKYCYSSVCPMGHHDCLRLVPPESIVVSALELVQERSRRSAASSR